MRNRAKGLIFIKILVASTLLSACSVFNPTPAKDWPGRSETLTALAPLNTPISTQAAIPPADASTPQNVPTSPSVTQAPPTQTPRPSPTQAPCYQAEFVKDVTIPDGTSMTPGQKFNKTWQLWNTGSCDWPGSMQVIFYSGTQMSADSHDVIKYPIPSGKMGNVTVSMIAPDTTGDFTSNWKLQPVNGTAFGVGAKSVPFYVKISVADSAFRVVDAAVGVDNASFTGPCPPGNTFNFTAEITTTAAGTVTYHWFFSDGSVGSAQNLSFSGPETKTVTTTWTVTTSTSGSAGIYIESPNHQSFPNGGDFTMTCQ